MPQINVPSLDLHQLKMKKLSERTKLRPSKNIHINIRPSHHDSGISFPNSMTDTSHQMLNDSSMYQTALIKSENNVKQNKNDQSFKYRHVSSTSFNERSSFEQTTEDPYLKSENISRISKPESVKQNFSRRRGICCSPIQCCICLPILIALFLCAAALLITSSVLASMKSRSVDTLSTMSTTTSTSTSSTSSTSTSETTSTSTSTSSTTTTTTGITWLTTSTDTGYPVWNTSVGGDSTPATVGTNVGNFYPGEIADYAFDNTTGTKYTNFGFCFLGGPASSTCGVETGLYVTPQRGPSSLVTLQFCTANDIPNRDPFTITIEGTNQPSSSLTLGSSWTLIYNGTTGLQPHMNRFECGPILFVSNNSNWYSSYRILVTSVRGNDVATQYSELRLFGYQ